MTFWHKVRRSTNTFLNSVHNGARSVYATLVDEYAAKEKIGALFILAINTLIAGALVWYVVEHRNFISYGITAALAMYWFEYAVTTIRGTRKEQ